MTPAETQIKEELEATIRRHRELYYNQKAEISDESFDELVGALRVLDPDSPVLAEVGAPVMGEKRKHKIPMGSLEKCPVEDFAVWVDKAPGPYLLQEKYDGISIDLEYEKGRLVLCLTRGDGFEGEVVNNNVMRIPGVHVELPNEFTGSVRGEIFCRISTFEEYLRPLGFANPRNAVSGIIRNRGAGGAADAFDIRYFDVSGAFSTEGAKLQFLYHTLGLETAYTFFNVDAEDVQIEYTKYRDERRETRDYEIDGLVVKVDDCVTQKRLGVVGNRPKWAIALKFPPPVGKTILETVDWQLGLGGRITPVARLSPVQVGGVTIQNATLHHAEYIRDLGIRIGDTVNVIRAGDVIPQVAGITPDMPRGTGAINPPRICPECEGSVVVEGKFILCHNEGCIGLVYGSVAKWVEVMEIDSLGPAWLEKLIQSGWVEEPADLYALTIPKLCELDRMGTALATRIFTNIQQTKRPPLEKFAAGLNIPGFSVSRARMLIEAGKLYIRDDGLADLRPIDELETVDGFGEIMAGRVYVGWANLAGTIRSLYDIGVMPAAPAASASQRLAGKSFCFTGAIQSENPDTGKRYTRAQMQALVRESGGVVASGVGKGLDYLVMADPSSTSIKTKKAREGGVRLLSEDDFFHMLNG